MKHKITCFGPKPSGAPFTCALHHSPHALKNLVGKTHLVCCSKAMCHQNQNIFLNHIKSGDNCVGSYKEVECTYL